MGHEHCCELRDEMAGADMSRGNALAIQGRMNETLADCAISISLYEELVHRECRGDLRNDLELHIFLDRITLGIFTSHFAAGNSTRPGVVVRML
jgi:hypothetical protein